jgi:hypothetical protein
MPTIVASCLRDSTNAPGEQALAPAWRVTQMTAWGLVQRVFTMHGVGHAS